MKKSMYFLLILFIIISYMMGELIIDSILPKDFGDLELFKIELHYRKLLLFIKLSLWFYMASLLYYLYQKLYKRGLNNILIIISSIVEVSFIYYVIQYSNSGYIIIVFGVTLVFIFIITQILMKTNK